MVTSEGQNIKLVGIECDVSKEEAVKSVFDQVIATFGRVDVVVASAGRALNITERFAQTSS